MRRTTLAGTIAATTGALLVVALLLDWWDHPTAFENPAALSEEGRFLAESIQKTGEPLDEDAFRYFEVRDVLWLVAGVVCFAFGLFVLTVRRVAVPVALGVGAVMLATTASIAASLISPLEYADLIPDGVTRIDFGTEVSLEPDLGGFVALGAALTGLAATALASISSRTETGAR